MSEGGPGHWIGVWAMGVLIVTAGLALLYAIFKWSHEQFMR